jgi:hypothetical protein
MKFFLILLLVSQAAVAQKGTLTPVRATKVSLVPPEGFSPSDGFTGFVNESGAFIMVVEVPAPLTEAAAGFTKDNLEKKGFVFITRDTVEHNRSTAYHIKFRQQANGITYVKNILVFGDKNHTVLVNGMYPEDMLQIEGDIEESLFTATYNADKVVDPLEGISFEVDPESEGFKLLSNVAGSIGYAFSDAAKPNPATDPTFIITPAIEGVHVMDRTQYAIQNFRKLLEDGNYKVHQTDSVNIDNMPGVEFTAYNESRSSALYMVMLFPSDDAYLLMFGRADRDPETFIQKYRRITRTYKRKSPTK